MKKLLLVLTALLCVTATQAQAKVALICTGMFGEVVAPMTDYVAPLKAKGYTVVYGSWRALPDIKPDIVISHSACADSAPKAYPKAKHFPLDGTWWGILAGGCPKGTNCENYYAPIDKMPFLVCCGGYPTLGSSKTYKVGGTMSFFIFAPGHVTLPSRVRDRVLKSVP